MDEQNKVTPIGITNFRNQNKPFGIKKKTNGPLKAIKNSHKTKIIEHSGRKYGRNKS